MATATTIGQCGTEQVFNMNGLFDPDLTGGTHQPYAYDQIAALYSKYVVTKLDVEIHSNLPSATPDAYVLGLFAQGDATFSGLTGLAVTDVIEKQGGSALWLASTGAPTIDRFSVNIPSLVGLTREEYVGQADGRWGGTATTNPASPVYLRCALANLTSTTSRTAPIVFVFRFHVEWYDRVPLAASN